MKIQHIALTLVAVAGFVSVSTAASVSWNPAFEIETDADIVVSQEIVRAVNVVDPGAEFEIEVEFPTGVTVEFEPEHTFEFNADLDEEFFSGGNVTGTGNFYSGQDEALTTGNPELDLILDSHGWAGASPGGGIAVLELADLTVGTTYQIQLIGAADDRDCCEFRQMEIWDDDLEPIADVNGEELWFGRSNDFDQDDERGPGSVIGTFTADDTVQLINLVGTADFDDGNGQFGNGNDPGLSAYVLSLASPLAPTGDYNMDGMLDVMDIDLQAVEMKKDPADQDLAKFDHNSDNVVNGDDRTIWVKDLRRTWVGDANLDDEFNSGDLVVVFAAGKYETESMASWGDGDWNGDMLFDSGDLVVAFADGGYEMGPAARAVPEPSSLMLTLMALTGLLRRLTTC